MRSLFFKIIEWYRVSGIIVAGVQFLTTVSTSFPPHHDRFMAISNYLCSGFGHEAVAILERQGKNGLSRYLQDIERKADIQLFLFNDGKPIFPEQEVSVSPDELTPLADEIMPPHFPQPIEAKAVIDSGGKKYKVMMKMFPPDPMEPMSSNLGVLSLRLTAVLLMAGAVCYGLASYLTAPLSKLRQAAKRLADGDLSVRTGVAVGKRHDEIGDLGKDFDFMAERIETLMIGQRRLLRDISHELRSPLTRLNVALELARQRAGAEAQGDLSRIELEVNRLNELIGQLLTLSRLESKLTDNSKTKMNMADIINQIAEDADFEAHSRNRRVSVQILDRPVIVGIQALLRSAIENIVRNAIYYTAENTTVEISLRQSVNDNESYVVIGVQDHGPGIPERELEKIFQPFYRVADARDRGTGGVGLGLAITDRAVRLHGGMVKAANIKEGGLLVEIILPIAENNTKTDTNQRETEKPQ